MSKRDTTHRSITEFEFAVEWRAVVANDPIGWREGVNCLSSGGQKSLTFVHIRNILIESVGLGFEFEDNYYNNDD